MSKWERMLLASGRSSSLKGSAIWVADALFLYGRLQRDYFWRDQFTMASKYGASFGMGRRRQTNATKALMAAKAIRRLTRGGRFDGDAPMYAWIKKGEWE